MSRRWSVWKGDKWMIEAEWKAAKDRCEELKNRGPYMNAHYMAAYDLPDALNMLGRAMECLRLEACDTTHEYVHGREDADELLCEWAQPTKEAWRLRMMKKKPTKDKQ